MTLLPAAIDIFLGKLLIIRAAEREREKERERERERERKREREKEIREGFNCWSLLAWRCHCEGVLYFFGGVLILCMTDVVISII